MVNLLLLDRTLSHEQAIANGLADRWKLPRAECCYGWSSYRLLNGFSSGTRRTLLKPASRESSCSFPSGRPTVVDGIVDDIKGGDHIIPFGEARPLAALSVAAPFAVLR